jgi:hypothetical protein
MARASTTSGAFNVVAEPRRRQMLDVLALGEKPLSEGRITMSGCCDAAGDRKTPAWLRRVREILAWVLPSAILVLVPKCPACLAAHVMLWTGLGLSFSTATYLRCVLLFLCVASLLCLILKRLARIATIFRYFKKETEPCNAKS